MINCWCIYFANCGAFYTSWRATRSQCHDVSTRIPVFCSHFGSLCRQLRNCVPCLSGAVGWWKHSCAKQTPLEAFFRAVYKWSIDKDSRSLWKCFGDKRLKEAEFDKELALEKYEAANGKMARLDLESERLSLIREGKLCDMSQNEVLAWGSENSCDILSSLRSVPQFNAKEFEAFCSPCAPIRVVWSWSYNGGAPCSACWWGSADSESLCSSCAVRIHMYS